jgi:2',3'-cyclic-nucleotide 2'-phosphodiesterase (5'-nucleotidase family)
MFHPNPAWTRRDFLKLLGRAGLLSAIPGVAGAAAALDSNAVWISILHTTDLHGRILPSLDYEGNLELGGLARCVTQIRRWRRKNRNSILIDVGDVYQGTDVSLRSKGKLMIDLFNHLKYDAWIVGNHEFDWGMEPFLQAVQRSKMPVLAANSLLEGKPAGEITDPRNPFSRIRPHIIKDFAGIRIAIIGVTTPGMPFWFRPEFTRGFESAYPVEPVRRAVQEAKGDGANAIILAGHMGLKPRSGGDDFANAVMSLTSEFPETAAFIAGHTHQLVPSRLTNGVLVTQANHFGIHVGRLDLVFDRESRKLVARHAECQLMDGCFRLDHIVLSRAKPLLDESEIALAQPIGELAETFRVHAKVDDPSDVERLLGVAIIDSLRERGVLIDGAMHGLFDDKNDFEAGPKTIRDVWNIIPYENYLVTAELTPEELQAIIEETYSTHERRSLLGFNIHSELQGGARRIVSMTLDNGAPLERGRRYVIAFNSFDSRSAGHRFMKLRSLLESPVVNCQFHPVQTRDALIDYFRRHKVIHKIEPAQLAVAE